MIRDHIIQRHANRWTAANFLRSWNLEYDTPYTVKPGDSLPPALAQSHLRVPHHGSVQVRSPERWRAVLHSKICAVDQSVWVAHDRCRTVESVSTSCSKPKVVWRPQRVRPIESTCGRLLISNNLDRTSTAVLRRRSTTYWSRLRASCLLPLGFGNITPGRPEVVIK